ncbi:ABC transporter permease [Micromonospora sp. NPDC049204]|uniref:ABC transporter permease n=1 Tax=Micromonospora sp. NPDC049204 TaxID=3154351 RepID=UPI0033EFC776
MAVLTAGRRMLHAVLVLWAAYTLSFVLLYVLPGDPVAVMAAGGGDATTVAAGQLDALRAEHGLDRPLPEQYLDRLTGTVRGDLGTSVQTGEPVARMLLDALPPTLQLAAGALGLGVPLGAAVALLAAYVRRRGLRRLLLSLPGAGISVPTFWVGLVLLQVFSFRWALLPAFGDGSAAAVLPAITLALPVAALVGQTFARGLGDALAQPYLDTAAAKGAGRARLLLRHAARNAALTPLAVTGVLAGNILAGAVVVETVFSRHGIGRLTATAVAAQDIPVVQGAVILGAACFVLVSLATELLMPVLDPRLRTATGAREVVHG